jgi:DNA-binding response OmpR family regulator
MRVLVVEDDRALGLFLQKGLKLEGHDVEWVGDGDAALEHTLAHRPDLIVLDLSLPRRDGTQVLEALQGHLEGTSVLVLTGRSQLEDRIKCLNLGADDCLLKPFSFHELSARCRAILRRREKFADPVLRYAGVEMNRMNRGMCCSRSELLSEVWQMSPETGTNVVDVYVNYLRKKLAVAQPDGHSTESVIETVRGEGYRLRGMKKPPMKIQDYASVPLAQGA